MDQTTSRKIRHKDNPLSTINPYYAEKATGRKKMEMTMMLKIYFLQEWYNLSDPEAEEEIYDRNTFQKWFFEVVKERLEASGLLMKEGTIVDATIINAPSSTKNQNKERDPEMHQTQKGKTWYFGMKGHIGVDSQSGLIHHLEITPANVNDCTMMEYLLHGKERALFADKAYANRKVKRRARNGEFFYGILDRGTTRRCLSSSQRKRNRKLSSIRSNVEHPFQVIKCQWQYTKVRYKGLFKNTMQLFSLFALVNLFRVRKTLLAMA